MFFEDPFYDPAVSASAVLIVLPVAAIIVPIFLRYIFTFKILSDRIEIRALFFVPVGEILFSNIQYMRIAESVFDGISFFPVSYGIDPFSRRIVMKVRGERRSKFKNGQIKARNAAGIVVAFNRYTAGN